ncbi:hypothetical protein ACIXN7_05705 [Bacteroides fragilis]
MDTILSILNWLATVGTLILGVYMYRKHTRRLNEQQKQLNEQQGRINDYLLKGMEESERKKKSAYILCEVIRTPRGEADILRIQNKGEGVARQINLVLKDDRVVLNLPSDEYFPYPQLLAEQYLDIRYFSPWMTQKLTLTWDDELKEGKVLEQIVTL